jgi:multidrug resistance efflux pump
MDDREPTAAEKYDRLVGGPGRDAASSSARRTVMDPRPPAAALAPLGGGRPAPHGPAFFGEGAALDPQASPTTLEPHDADLRARLAEAEEALRAIRNGEVDALLVEAPDGIHVHSIVDRKWPRRLIRWTIGGSMLAAAGWYAASTILFRSSVQATITAPLVAVRIPQQGLVYGAPPAVGATVTAGERLFDVQPPAGDERPSERLRAESVSLRRTASALSDQIREMDALKERLSQHFKEYRDVRILQAEKLAAEREARAGAAAADLKTAELELNAQKRMSLKGSASTIDLARAEHAAEHARHELEVARQAAARTQIQLDAARKGLFVSETDGGQDRGASHQRIDEIEIQQATLRARLGELEGKLHEAEARLASEGQYVAGRHRLSVTAPVGGVVWSSAVATASVVSPGATALEILDPSQLIIEATFNKAEAGQVRPGESIKARLVGSSTTLSGRVVRVAGPGASDQGPIGVAARVPASPETFRAIIKLDDQPEGGSAANHYYVGRSAVVWVVR